MNPNPEHPEPLNAGIDPLLLNEAAQPEFAPQDLEAKILCLTDPAMLSLLDAACAPEAAPQGLAQRILAATAGASAHADSAEPMVIARIGFGFATWRYAVAAGIVLAAGAGLWWVAQQGGEPQAPRLANVITTPSDDPTAETADAWTQSLSYGNGLFADATSPVQNTIETLSEDLRSGTLEVDSIWSDMDAYEQFLSETEPQQGSSAT